MVSGFDKARKDARQTNGTRKIFRNVLKDVARLVDIDKAGATIIAEVDGFGVEGWREFAFAVCVEAERQGVFDRVFPLETVAK